MDMTEKRVGKPENRLIETIQERKIEKEVTTLWTNV